MAEVNRKGGERPQNSRPRRQFHYNPPPNWTASKLAPPPRLHQRSPALAARNGLYSARSAGSEGLANGQNSASDCTEKAEKAARRWRRHQRRDSQRPRRRQRGRVPRSARAARGRRSDDRRRHLWQGRVLAECRCRPLPPPGHRFEVRCRLPAAAVRRCLAGLRGVGSALHGRTVSPRGFAASGRRHARGLSRPLLERQADCGRAEVS